MDADAQGRVRKEIAEAPWVFVLMWLGFPLIGGALLWGLSRFVDWLSGQDWVPFEGLFDLAASAPEPYLTIGAIVVGVLLGLGLAFLGHADSLKVTITDDDITATRGGKSKKVATTDVTGAFRDGKYLVLLGANGTELLREKTDIPRERMRQDFIDCGFTWHEADPHADEWRRWVDGTPDLPKGGNALLRTRTKELKKMDPDLADIDKELRDLGVMVRYDKGKHYWRLSNRD
ncbi:YqeB family protein [Stackebrandtia nassauensis]|uniref:YqeB n=1 Tax=Stackebrandtia nassauensis (strain DSM 44728 / CIP 108903 / NRRL B-16338 / NBRC 102104 / LLR-40K-21) TaxID=446470 RepID=D3QAK4_STANL|nr:hypothetical protein [Stackebrandtia nassauensis]ADD42787.1 hypothetical protein Snas_3116 [Stackebrandtia nassauensis DSM 44728]